MKKLFCLLLSALLVFGLVACGETESQEQGNADVLQIGFGRTDITPEIGTDLSSTGTGASSRVCEGVSDNLYAHAVVLKDSDGTVMIIVTTDMSWGDQAMMGVLRPLVQEKYGVDQEHFLMGGVHNHNAPAYGGASTLNREWTENFHNAVMEAIEIAMNDLAPASVEIGTTQTEGLTYVRRYICEDGSLTGEFDTYEVNSPIKEPESEADTQMQLVRIKREGKKDLIMVNWQCHPNKHGASQPFASADFIGPLRKKVEEELDALCIFYQGATGNLNSYSRIGGDKVHGQGWDACVQFGELAADYAIAALKAEGTMQPVKLGKIKNEQTKFITTRGWAEANTIACGELSFVTLPAEFFDTFGMTIKDETPFKMTVLLGYHCASVANTGRYLATELGFKNGGYEARNTYFKSGDGEKFTQYFVDTLNKLYQS